MRRPVFGPTIQSGISRNENAEDHLEKEVKTALSKTQPLRREALVQLPKEQDL